MAVFDAAHFETDKAFPLTEALPTFRDIAAFTAREPHRALLVAGHTDAVGGASHNQGLSEDRAAAVAAYLKNDVEAFYVFYEGAPKSKKWGTHEDQLMLAALPFDSTDKYLKRAPGTAVNATVKAAFKKFQKSASIPETGAADKDTRKKLIGAYMAADGTSTPANAIITTLGCGEKNLKEKTQRASKTNRRVEVFAFEKAEFRPTVDEYGSDPKVYQAWIDATKPMPVAPPAPPPRAAAEPKAEEPKAEEPKAEEPAKPEEKKDDDKPPSEAETASSGEKAAEALALKNEPKLKPLQDQYRAALEKSANTMSKDDACVILAFLHHAGFIHLLTSPFNSRARKAPSISGSTLQWPKASDRVGFGPWIKFKEGGTALPEPGASKVGPVEGHFGYIYNDVNAKWAKDRAVIKDKTVQVGNVDPRSAVALYRAANWMQENYGVTECYHAAVNGDSSGVRNDCHGQGRALDFSGVVGSMSGKSYEWFVLADWGMQKVPPGKSGDTSHWPYKAGGTTYRMANRLEEPQPSPARFFWDFYKFACTQWHAGGPPELPRSFDTPITKDGFIYYPDTFASNKDKSSGREAHQNHMHVQIGATGTE